MTKRETRSADAILSEVEYYQSRRSTLATEDLGIEQPIPDAQAAMEMTCSTFKTPARIIE